MGWFPKDGNFALFYDTFEGGNCWTAVVKPAMNSKFMKMHCEFGCILNALQCIAVNCWGVGAELALSGNHALL